MEYIHFSYLIFNNSLKDQHLRADDKNSFETHLKYIRNSISSLLATNSLQDIKITIWYVEIKKDKTKEKSLLKLAAELGQENLMIAKIKMEELQLPLKLNKNDCFSISSFQGYLRYLIIKKTIGCKYYCFIDADTLFLQKDFISICINKMEKENRIFGGFLELSQSPNTLFRTNNYEYFPRFHTFFYIINTNEFKKIINLDSFLSCITQERDHQSDLLFFEQIQNKELYLMIKNLIDHNYLHFDTFTELTFYLLLDDNPKALILNNTISGYFIDKECPLNIGNNFFIHSKYLTKSNLSSLLKKLKDSPLEKLILDKIRLLE